jgi:catalase
VISMLANVSAELAQGVADGIGIAVPPNQPRVLETPADPEVTISAALSLLARPGDGSVKGRKVALLVADGIDAESLRRVHAALADAGAVPRFIGARLGRIQPAAGAPIDVEVTMETAPSVLWDAVVVPAEDASLALYGQALEFVKDQYRHCKTIVCLGETSALLDAAALPTSLPDGGADPGLLRMPDVDEAAAMLITTLAGPRHFARETDPPRV